MVLATLDSKKQVLVLGHAIIMPVVVQTRKYDELFSQHMVPPVSTVMIDDFIKELF
jgi:uncharacterized protein